MTYPWPCPTVQTLDRLIDEAKEQQLTAETSDVFRMLRELDGSNREAVKLITGLTDDEIDDLGGLDD